MNRRSLLGLVCLPLAAACITQEMEVCCPDAPGDAPVRDGTLQVVPEWEPGSLDVYLGWMNSKDPAVRENVELFQAELKRVLRAGLGDPFPKARMPHVDPRDALALGLRRKTIDPDETQDQMAPVGRTQAAQSADELDAMELMLERAVHQAVNGYNPDLHVAGYTPSKREVTYVIENGVTYCIYGAYVVDTGPSIHGSPHWWVASHRDRDGNTATAYLNLVAIVRQID